jgi:hypothetical protein
LRLDSVEAGDLLELIAVAIGCSSADLAEGYSGVERAFLSLFCA